MTDQYCTRCDKEFEEYEDVIVITGGMVESSLAFPNDFTVTLNDSPHIEVMCSDCFNPKPNRVVVELEKGLFVSSTIKAIRAERPDEACVFVRGYTGVLAYGVGGDKPIKQLSAVEEACEPYPDTNEPYPIVDDAGGWPEPSEAW